MERTGSILLVPLDQPMIENGLLECNGNSYLISDYPDLYGAIENKYGGNETNFNVPSMEYGDGFKFGIVFLKTLDQIDDSEEPEAAMPTLDQTIQDKIAWGNNVVRQFRVFSMSFSDEQGLQMLGNLIDVKMALELGMLGGAAYMLQNKPEDGLLDSPFNESLTVRERFINMILNEGPTP